jgi:hypothetical protein
MTKSMRVLHSPAMSWGGMLRPGMRAYLVPLLAGLALAASVFLPWVVVGDATLAGFPDIAALWVLGLGALAAVLATASLITRKNSRHPLLLVGLVALGITFLSWRIMPQTIAGRLKTRSQALAIVENTRAGETPPTLPGSGIYLGLAASGAIVAFGLTIVFKRVSQAYVVEDPNDDA